MDFKPLEEKLSTKNILFILKRQRIEKLKELINNNSPELIILQNVKKYMVNGTLELEGLSSKQRSYLHNLAEKYNMEHFSKGNYNDRILVIKDKSHTYFSNTTENQKWGRTFAEMMFNNDLEKYKKEQSDKEDIDKNVKEADEKIDDKKEEEE